MMAIMARDLEAVLDFENDFSSRQRKKFRHAQMLEGLNMARGDRESATFQKIDKLRGFTSTLQKSLKRKHDQLQQQRHPAPKFKAGQSIVQWWADWMKSVKEPPAGYGKKTYKRPSWYVGDVLAFVRYGTSRYAGVEITDNWYKVH